MTKKELVEMLAFYPDDAIIYVEADHAQTPLQADCLGLSKDEKDEQDKLPYDGEDMCWRETKDVKKTDQVTAISIVN
jgi:hypothetical protein